MPDTDKDAVPRYEFRAFARCFERSAGRLRKLSRCDSIEEITDIYLVSAGAWQYNVKIRENQLSIKKLLENRDGLELWRPWLNLDFPAAAADLGKHVLRSLALEISELRRTEMSQEEFLKDVVAPHPQITIGQVFKRRFRFLLNNCPVEAVEIVVNGATIQSMAVEGQDPGDVLEIRDMLGLQVYENLSYLMAMKRIMGHGVLVQQPAGPRGGREDGTGN